VDYAVGRKKLKRFMVLYPQSEQGREYKELFANAVQQAGGRVVTANSYSSNRTEFAATLREMSMGSEEGQKYDAIFIPDSFGPAGYIATTFATTGLESVPLLGISRWDDSRLISIGGKYVEGAVFPEAFYKKSVDPETQTFVSRFTTAYNIEPTLLEALGYDSMRMVLEAVKNGAAHRSTVRDALARLNDFKGATGRISFNEQRDATRELPLLTVSGGAIRPLSK
jgi:ABC-type branched-subunit amino acid transport system substrate-binding protein